MKYENLVALHLKESRRKDLTPLEKRFYSEAQAYLKSLKGRYDSETRENPGSPDTMELYREYINTREILEKIVNLRAEKLMKKVYINLAFGEEVSTRGMTEEEVEMYNHLTSYLRQWKEALISGGKQPQTATTEEKEEDHTVLLRILKDLPKFVTSEGRVYALRSGDVANLPERIASRLLDKNLAERIEVEH